jgi:hypothetical protein
LELNTGCPEVLVSWIGAGTLAPGTAPGWAKAVRPKYSNQELTDIFQQPLGPKRDLAEKQPNQHS